MKKFRFPLETARKLRKHQLDIEEAKLAANRQELGQLDEMGRQLSEWGSHEETLVLRKSILKAQELTSLADFRRYLRKQQDRLALLRGQSEQRLTVQMKRVQDARRAAELLNKLRERAHEHWEKAANKEWDAFAEEVFIAQWKTSL